MGTGVTLIIIAGLADVLITTATDAGIFWALIGILFRGTPVMAAWQLQRLQLMLPLLQRQVPTTIIYAAGIGRTPSTGNYTLASSLFRSRSSTCPPGPLTHCLRRAPGTLPLPLGPKVKKVPVLRTIPAATLGSFRALACQSSHNSSTPKRWLAGRIVFKKKL